MRSFTRISRTIRRATTILGCLALLLGQSLTCLATGDTQVTSWPDSTTQIEDTTGCGDQPSGTTMPVEDTTRIDPPKAPEPKPEDHDVNQPGEGPRRPERPPFLTLIHTSIPDNSTPEDYGLQGRNWDVYDLAKVGNGSFKIELFGNITNKITVEELDEGLFRAELLEKQAILGHEIDLTYKLNELVLVPADGGKFPCTKHNEHKLFTGTMRILPYNGVIHHIVISEQYEVQPGDTLSQIIIDCGWLPEGRNLYGEDGYLEQYAKEQKFDLSRPLIPGEVVLWHSEEIKVVDNLYPDIKIDFIPGNFFSNAKPATFGEDVTDLANLLPIISDLIEIRQP